MQKVDRLGPKLTRSRLVEWSRIAIWTIGLAFFVTIATLATVEFVSDISDVHRTTGPLLLTGALLIATGIAAVFLSGRGPLRTHPLAVGLGLILVTRLVMVATIQTPLFSDFLLYHALAVQMSQQGPLWAIVPIGWPLELASVYAVLGPNPLFGELLNLAMALATGWFIFDLSLRMFGRPGASLSLWLFALAPAQAVWVVVLGSEAPYGLLLIAAVWAIARFGIDRIGAPVLAGLLLGAAQYVRATTPVIIAAFVVVIILAGSTPARALRAVAIIAAVFLLTLSPVIVHDYQQSGVLSVSTSAYGGWSLFVGTSSANDGQYDPTLMAVVGGQVGTPEFDRRALTLALDRIEHNPAGVAELAAKKVPIMWASESYPTDWTFQIRARGNTAVVRAMLIVVDQAFYAIILALAALGLWRWRHARSTMVLLIILIILSVAAMHTVLEVQSRYHAYLEPLMCVLAGSALATTRLARRLQTESGGLLVDEPDEPVANEYAAQDD
jgi:hypothetical protein